VLSLREWGAEAEASEDGGTRTGSSAAGCGLGSILAEFLDNIEGLVYEVDTVFICRPMEGEGCKAKAYINSRMRTCTVTHLLSAKAFV
jgi:hypothetical protein